MIHKHQIVSLSKYAEFKNVVSGFIFNFRDEASELERTYFQNIDDFMYMVKNINKSSFNEKDLLLYNPVIIHGAKKRINYSWNLNLLLAL